MSIATPLANPGENDLADGACESARRRMEMCGAP
jgi:hypothetical protein